MIFLTGALLLLMAGCTRHGEVLPSQEVLPGETEQATVEQEPEYAYSLVYRRVPNGDNTAFLMEGNVWQCTLEERNYEFDRTLEQEQRDRFISAQEQLCAYLKSNGLSTDGLVFRILKDSTNWTESDSQLAYFDIANTETWHQALTTVQAVLGDYTNYGYLYALCNRIAGELGWEQEMSYWAYVKNEYTLRPAFGEYFIRTYGEENFLNSMLSPSRVKEYTGKTMDEIMDDFALDMEIPEND